MSIAEYRAAKDRLKAFDGWALRACNAGARLVPNAGLTIHDRRTDGYAGDWTLKNDDFDKTLFAHLNTHTLYKLMAKTREKLVEDCRRLKITAANEARGIIAEDAPK